VSEVAISEVDKKKKGKSITQNSSINKTFLREIIIANCFYLRFYEDKVTDDIHLLLIPTVFVSGNGIIIEIKV